MAVTKRAIAITSLQREFTTVLRQQAGFGKLFAGLILITGCRNNRL
jgi:hypothetical protein